MMTEVNVSATVGMSATVRMSATVEEMSMTVGECLQQWECPQKWGNVRNSGGNVCNSGEMEYGLENLRGEIVIHNTV